MEMVKKVSRFDIFRVRLDPTEGSEIKKSRPCVVVSPDEMNLHINTVIVVPMTTKGRHYPTRVPINFQAKTGLVVLDQIRTVDKSRLTKRLGALDSHQAKKIIDVLQEMFCW